MNKKIMPRLAIALFLLVIFIVSISQAIVEKKRGETIQFFDIFIDTFHQPYTREKKSKEYIALAQSRIDSVQTLISQSPESDGALNVSERALFALDDFRAARLEINRHISADTSKKVFQTIAQTRQHIDEVYELLLIAEQIDTVPELLTAISENLSALDSLILSPNLFTWAELTFKHFFAYTVFSQKYLRAWEGEMEETSIYANALRPPMQMLRYKLLGDLGDKAIDGKDGWLFYKPGIEYLTRPYIRDERSIIVDPNDKPLIDDPIQAIVRFENQLQEKGIDLLVVIVPGKASIYPDKVSGKLSAEDAGEFSHTNRTLQQLSEAGIKVVDLFEPFAQERLRDQQLGSTMYLERDTHWKSRGARLAAQCVKDAVDKLQIPFTSFGSISYELDTVTVDRIGDVGTMTTLPDINFLGLTVKFPVEKTLCYRVLKQKLDSSGTVVSTSPYRDDLRESEILILGDSFSRIYQTDEPRSAGWISHLAYELQAPLFSIVSDGGASTLVREKLARAPQVLTGKKLVIWEFVERDLRFGAKGWADVEL